MLQGELTVRETFDFSARVQSTGYRKGGLVLLLLLLLLIQALHGVGVGSSSGIDAAQQVHLLRWLAEDCMVGSLRTSVSGPL